MTNRKNRLLTFLVFAILCAAQSGYAQKTFFVYVQSDNQQPFYINISGKNVSSSSIGYAILSKLHDSTYPIKIGFAKGGTPVEFDLAINGNDQGFLLKEFGEKGFGLFNLQTMAVVMNSNEANKKKAADALASAENEKRVADSLAAATLIAAQQQPKDSIDMAAANALEKAIADSNAATAIAGGAIVADQIKDKDSMVQVASQHVENAIPDSTAAAAAMAALDKAEKQKADSLNAVDSNTTKTHSADTASAITMAKDPLKVVSVALPTAVVAAVVTDKAMEVTKEGRENKKDLIASDTALVVEAKPILGQDTTAGTVAVKADSSKAVADTAITNATKTIAAVAAIKTVAKRDSADPRFLDMEIATDTASAAAAPKPLLGEVVNVQPVDSTLKAVEAQLPLQATATSDIKGTITSNNSNTIIVAAPVVAIENASPVESTVVNNHCKKIASDKDYFNLRKKITAAGSVPEMILEAKSAFKQKCYNNEQLRNLCLIFNDDVSRLRFLDEAYPYTTDPQAYKQLGNLLRDDFYTRRFNAIVK